MIECIRDLIVFKCGAGGVEKLALSSGNDCIGWCAIYASEGVKE
jgi:hypothetical protein